MTGLIGALVEAWDELRSHKLRVVLALVGVAVAVFTITLIAAAGSMARQVATEWNERWGGRPVTLSATAWAADGSGVIASATAGTSAGAVGPSRAGAGGSAVGPSRSGARSAASATGVSRAAYQATFDQIIRRYSIGFASLYADVATKAQFPAGSRTVVVHGVSPDYRVMHRIVMDQGRWFVPADAERLSPALIVNQAFLDALGVPSLATHPTVTMGTHVVATIIGSYANTWSTDEPQAYALFGAQETWSTPAEIALGVPTMEFWVPDTIAGTLRTLIRADLISALPGTQVDVYRQDVPVVDVVDGAVRWVIIGVTAAALVLGALGLVNIALVSVRTRMREIGIRRSLGATSRRIFASVLLESVVATTLAGLFGVVVAMIVLRYVPLDTLMGQPVQTQPAFPWFAAGAGLGVAVAVGTVCGLLPAIVAVRIRVIDAIRT